MVRQPPGLPQDRLDSRGKYYPYGEERTGITPPNPPNDQEKFASYTRDSATGLDYADQRYYDNLIGRFMKPDPFGGSANVFSPQSWNRYAYAGNDPANNFDPSGLDDSYNEYQTGTGLPSDYGNFGGPIPVSCPGCDTTVTAAPDPIAPVGSVTYAYTSGGGGGALTSGGGGSSTSPVINLQNISKSGSNENVILNTLKTILADLDDKCTSFFGGRTNFTDSLNSFLG